MHPKSKMVLLCIKKPGKDENDLKKHQLTSETLKKKCSGEKTTAGLPATLAKPSFLQKLVFNKKKSSFSLDQ